MPIRYAPRCDVCNSLYIKGSQSTCSRCQRRKGKKKRRWRDQALLYCDCGQQAEAVILVRVGLAEDGMSEERLPLCRDCLAVEKETQALLRELGIS